MRAPRTTTAPPPSSWTPEGPPPPPAGPQPAPASAGGWVRRLWPIFASHRRVIAVALVGSIFAVLAQAATPLVQRHIIDDSLYKRQPMAPYLIVMGGLFALRFAAGWVRRFHGGRISWEVDCDLRNAVYSHLQSLDFARHDELQTGQLTSRTNSDLNLVRQLLNQVPNLLTNLLQFLFALVIMFFLDAPLAAAVLPEIPILFYFSLRMRKVVYPSQWEAQARMAEMMGVVDDAVSGVRVVKGFGQERRELHRLLAALVKLFGSRMRNLRLRARRSSTLQAIPQFAQVGVFTLGAYLAFRGHLSVGTLVAFMTYLAQLASPARQMASVIVSAQQARAGAERVLELLDSLPDVTEREGASTLVVEHGAIAFEGVSFGYHRSEPVLSNLHLKVAPGETIAIVGTSGSGKSTIGLLLPRFYDVQQGRVRIEGVDVRDLTLGSLRRQIGVVFEDAFLFSDSIRSNIAFGRPDATEEQIEAAARAAEAHRFISNLPQGYDTVVGERGLLLSGGQRQRITLARALLTDPKILLLDDATSSIDSRVEEEIHHTLRRLMVGRTTILIAHRRSTLRLASRIVVLEGGSVLDSGSHEELMARCDSYRELISGPGESAEGGTAAADAPASPEAWEPPADELAGFEGVRFDLVSSRATRRGLGGPPTPELLEQIGKLPPVRDVPDLDNARETEQVAGRFHFARYLRPFYPQLAFGTLFVMLDALCGLVGPQIVRHTIDSGITGHRERVLFALAGLYLAVNTIDWWFMWREIFITGRTGERLLYGMRAKVFAHLQRLGLDYYDREMGGRVLTRMGSDVDTLSQLLQSGLVNALVNGASFLGVGFVLIAMNPHLALIVFIVIPPLLFGTFWYRARSRVAYDRQRDRIAAVNADLQESVSGVRVTQAFRREARSTENFRALTGQYRDAGIRSQFLQALYFPYAELAGNVAILLVLGFGYHLVHSGVLTVGALVAFLLYLTQLFAPIQQLSQVFDTYQQASAGLRRLGGLLETPVSVASASSAVVPQAMAGAIDFVDVHFAYPGQAAEALSGVDLHIAAGETVALVGETGAGKSTVVKLLARFYDPTAGEILIDGAPLTTLELAGYRQRLGYVPQEPFLFSATIRDNIAYGRPDATEAEVEAAARGVGAHDFIVAAGGYLSPVREGGRSLSIGQRQLLCFARALLVNPAILLLDEATSNLDLASEAKVNRAMAVVASGRTTVIIAHRLQTARRADRIFVVDAGQVVESGNHDELVAMGGFYATLWRAFDLAS
ncbi:MAG TPA: ABC transporter ATP-binding protein [Acidimicrobiales bacterium]|nr:ABC transporter ATP-binding protein [Acidimicrobiales bacterium]